MYNLGMMLSQTDNDWKYT